MNADLLCDRVIGAAWDYLDRRLDRAGTLRIDAHLSICPRCRVRYTFEGRFLAALASLGARVVDVRALRIRILAHLHP